jgi:hypothetical protein
MRPRLAPQIWEDLPRLPRLPALDSKIADLNVYTGFIGQPICE